MTGDRHQDAVQREVDRLLAGLLDLALAEGSGDVHGTLSGVIVGASAVRDALLLAGPAASVFDALAQLAVAVRDHYNEEIAHD